jgi:hypothetical protein
VDAPLPSGWPPARVGETREPGWPSEPGPTISGHGAARRTRPDARLSALPAHQAVRRRPVRTPARRAGQRPSPAQSPRPPVPQGSCGAGSWPRGHSRPRTATAGRSGTPRDGRSRWQTVCARHGQRWGPCGDGTGPAEVLTESRLLEALLRFAVRQIDREQLRFAEFRGCRHRMVGSRWPRGGRACSASAEPERNATLRRLGRRG